MARIAAVSSKPKAPLAQGEQLVDFRKVNVWAGRGGHNLHGRLSSCLYPGRFLPNSPTLNAMNTLRRCMISMLHTLLEFKSEHG